jgi:hypothetical protein
VKQLSRRPRRHGQAHCGHACLGHR